ncbi:hypothetical protein M885DRAFT_506375 [Pelagophyceae sp. CCMP2097]|nr:hypothetical protein M885DRAFT_506375 [Pelagophyceae sp. CCMP2097]
MPIISAKFGCNSMPAVVFNADCDCCILLDFIRATAVKETEAFARERDASIRAHAANADADLAALRQRADAAPPADGDAGPTAEALEAVVALRAEQAAALMAGIAAFRGLHDADFSSVDLVDAAGAPLKLFSTPKTNAKTLLKHRATYTVVRNGRPPDRATDGAPQPTDAATEVVPLTFDIPADPQPTETA